MEQSKRNQEAATELFRDLAAAGRFSGDLNNLIQNGGVTIGRHTLIVTKEISGMGGKNSLIDENTKRVIGLCNISGNSLPKNQALIFDEISLDHGTGSRDAVGSVKFNKAYPAELDNSELVIKQNGRVIYTCPVSNINPEGTPQSPDQKRLNTGAPHVLRDEQAIDLELHVPSGSTIDAGAASAYLFARLKIGGYATQRA